jgi:hypothetical protein
MAENQPQVTETRVTLELPPSVKLLRTLAGHQEIVHSVAFDPQSGTLGVGAIKEAENWLSQRAKEVIDRLGAAKHKHLKWERHEGVAMKGFVGKFTLWAVAG